MAELTLLLPELDRLSPTSSASLTLWTRRGDAQAPTEPGRAACLRTHFDFIGTSVPVAALTRSLDAADAATALWVRADPAWVMADAVTLRLMACGEVGLTREECDALAAALKPLFGDAGFPLEATTASRWYLRCPSGAQLPAFSAPSAALGDDIARHLPEGDAGRRWRHLLNEAQVILHNHPVNAARDRRGAVPVNSLWFWGAGKLPDWVRTAFTGVHGSDDVIRALAVRAGIAMIDDGAAALADFDPGARRLIDMAAVRDSLELDRQWLQPIAKLLAVRTLSSLHLHFASGERYTYRPAHRWRFWRRLPKSLAA
jgi:hypothetical protein